MARAQSHRQPHLEALPRSSALPYFVILEPLLSQQFIHLRLSLSNHPCPPVSMETLPRQGAQSYCGLVVQVSLESSDGDGEGMALTSPPAPCVRVCVLSVSLLAGIPQHCSPPNVGFPCAESVSLPAQHLTRWS